MSKIVHTFITGGAWKSVAGGVSSAIFFAIPVVDDGVVLSEALGMAGAFLIGSGIVYATKNRRPAV